MKAAPPAAGAATRPCAVQALCLAGPTASGKSALALTLAQRFDLEIVSVDSAQVYRGLDIGTAKPTAAERAAVPHHLLDLLDPAEAYSAARFVDDARRAVAAARARGRGALLVGGTMLYFKALREGLHALPPADAAVRAALDRDAAERGWPALHAELARVDPVTAARLAPADAQRVQRALEVWRVSGRALSAWLDAAPRGGVAAADAGAAWPLLALEPASRGWLHERIARRWRAMLDAGFDAEVRALRTRADLHAALPALRSVGYRQAWAALDDTGAPGGTAAWHDAALAATRQLAKRQLTWLRATPGRSVVVADAAGVDDAAVAWVEHHRRR